MGVQKLYSSSFALTKVLILYFIRSLFMSCPGDGEQLEVSLVSFSLSLQQFDGIYVKQLIPARVFYLHTL